MFLHCLEPIWRVFEPKNMVWKFTIFDLRRSFSRSRWPRRSKPMTYLESSRQDASYCMVKSLKKASWKIDADVKFSSADISKTVKKNFSATLARHIKRMKAIHMQNFRTKSWSIREKWRKIDFSQKTRELEKIEKRLNFPPNRSQDDFNDIWDDFEDLLEIGENCLWIK